MLLRFSIQNSRSFRDETVLSFVASARKEEPSLRFPSRHAKYGVLPVVGLWGANASGKSNLLEALLHVQGLIRRSYIGLAPDAAMPWPVWQPATETTPPPRCELDLLMPDDVRIHFGFELCEREGKFIVVEEWLYRYESTRRSVLYHRNEREEEPWYFGTALRGRRTQVAEATRANSLFISAAAQHNQVTLAPIYRAFDQLIVEEREIQLLQYPRFPADAPILSAAFRPTLVKLLKSADIGICAVSTRRTEKPLRKEMGLEKVFQPDAPNALKAEGDDLHHLQLHHSRGEKSPWVAPPEAESRGTSVLLARLANLPEVLNEGSLWVVDGLEESLHPELCALLVGLFKSPESNPNGAQLLFSTHARDMLDLLRTDEAWFAEKGRDGVSRIHSGSDFKSTTGRLRHAYTKGQMGGVPILGDFNALFAASKCR